jgi:hypothetical protein
MARVVSPKASTKSSPESQLVSNAPCEKEIYGTVCRANNWSESVDHPNRHRHVTCVEAFAQMRIRAKAKPIQAIWHRTIAMSRYGSLLSQPAE